jgi:hypothetical protein
MVYRVNELPLAFYDHIYDFGQLCNKAEDTHIDESVNTDCRNRNSMRIA